MFESDDSLKRFTTPPAEDTTMVVNETPPVEQVTEGVSQQTTTPEPPQVTTTVADEFIENLNKRFGTEFKGDDDVKSVLGLRQKIAEYEPKVKLADDYAKQVDEYKRQIEEIKNNTNSEFFSKPLIRSAYVAEQLLTKYPDKDPFALQEIAMTDVSKLSDLDALVKEQKIDLPGTTEQDLKEALAEQFGVDPNTPPEEWSSVARTRIAIAAKTARVNIKALTSGIELPKTVTKEEREAAQQQNYQKMVEAAAPLKEEFCKFDKFSKDGFEYDVPAEYKSQLNDMFDAMFFKAGLEPTKENLETAQEMKEALFLLNNFGKIKEVIAKEAKTALQKEIDEKLNNTTPPNTTTRTDFNATGDDLPGPGLAAFLERNK